MSGKTVHFTVTAPKPPPYENSIPQTSLGSQICVGLKSSVLMIRFYLSIDEELLR